MITQRLQGVIALAYRTIAVPLETAPQVGLRWISSVTLVIGAYGHARFCEFVFGGATRQMLWDASIAVPMSH